MKFLFARVYTKANDIHFQYFKFFLDCFGKMDMKRQAYGVIYMFL
jgi:hypothetical protein